MPTLTKPKRWNDENTVEHHLVLTLYRTAESATRTLKQSVIRELTAEELKGWTFLRGRTSTTQCEYAKHFDLYDRIAGEIEFCNIAISREAAACCSHGRKPMDLLAYIAEVLKGRHERSISLETSYLHFVPSGLSTHYDMQTMG